MYRNLFFNIIGLGDTLLVTADVENDVNSKNKKHINSGGRCHASRLIIALAGEAVVVSKVDKELGSVDRFNEVCISHPSLTRSVKVPSFMLRLLSKKELQTQ